MNIIFLGPPASGKDTQGELLRDNYGFTLISGGEALRDVVDEKGPDSETIQEYMARGELVPEEISQKILRSYLHKIGVKDRLVFTGSVRRMEQLGFIDELLLELGGKVDKVIYLSIPDEESVNRISKRWYSPSSGKTYHDIYKPPKVAGVDDETGEKLVKRADDTEEAVRERLRVFHEELQEIKAEYQARGVWTEVDGMLSIPQIHEQIVRVLELA